MLITIQDQYELLRAHIHSGCLAIVLWFPCLELAACCPTIEFLKSYFHLNFKHIFLSISVNGPFTFREEKQQKLKINKNVSLFSFHVVKWV